VYSVKDPGYRVLAVEDEPLLRDLLSRALEIKGHRVETCGNGEEALAKIEKTRFDVVITDFRMPRMTGLELIRILQGRAERIPIVLMSSNTLEELGVTAKDLAGVEYLRKPFGLTDLHASLRRAIKGADQRA
jgi:two-component system chemotaxis response regulator CheY